jgi:CRISPR-associated endonuclease Csn1
LITDENGKTVSLKRKLNYRPGTLQNEILLSGKIKDQRFESKQLRMTLDASDVKDGSYWAKIRVSDYVRISPMYIDKPIANEEHIVFKGFVSKGYFNNDTLGKRKTALEDGRYWAKVNISGISFELPEKGKEPSVNRNQILLYGIVKDEIFSSYIYKCKADLPDGKYWLILNINNEEIEYIKAENPKPQTFNNEFAITATVDQDSNMVADNDPGYHKSVNVLPGKYFAVLSIEPVPVDFYSIANEPDKLEKGQTLVEGIIWVDKYTGEIKFDPKKNRDDHRHHAVDAIAIALTEQAYLQHLSTENARRKNKQRMKEASTEKFPEPWLGFDKDVRNAVNSILVSHKKSNKVLTKNKKGFSVRGQLHKENVFGKRQAPMQDAGFHRRTKITDLKDHKDIAKVVDVTIQKIIKDHLAQKCNVNVNNSKGFEIPKDAFVKEGNWRLFLPNKNGDPVPIKKVRMKENLGKAVQLKSNLNQWVNPRNNHHVLIYKDYDGNLKEDVVQFWTVAERIMQGLDIYQLPEDGEEIVTTLEINDMFLIGMTDEEISSSKNDFKELSKNLYRVQKISTSYYNFRHHLASTVTNPYEEVRIQSMKAWLEANPKKLVIDELGMIYWK